MQEKFPDPRENVQKNLEEGRGFRLNDAIFSSGGKVLILNLLVQMNYGELH